jgi:hypothetical protein
LNVSTSGDGVDGGDPGENQPSIKERERIEIYDFDEAVGRGTLTKQPSAQKSQFLQRRPITWLSDLVHIVHHYRYLETGPAQSVDNYIDLSMSHIPGDHSVPNVSLNVSGQRTSEGELWMIAVVSILLQFGVIVFADYSVLLDKSGRFKKSAGPVAPYAFLMMTGGTVTLVLGMFLCVYIIDRNTDETKWVTPS